MTQKSSAKERLIRSVEITGASAVSVFVQKLNKKNTPQLDIDIHKIFKILFRQFLDPEEVNGLVDGVATKAALGGARHGRGAIARRGQRPSFVGAGVYGTSFRCWPDTKLPQ